MSDIKDWSNTAASNNSAAPDGAPEGMNPSDVNNVQREVMAAIRRQHEDAQWIDLGHTPTYSSTTVFLISGDVTRDYDVGRRVRVIDASTLYGTITASSYSSPNTSVTVSLDSGSLSASIASVSLGILSGSNHSFPQTSTSLGDQTFNDVTVDNLITAGNVDGRDVSADGAILDAIGVQNVKLNTNVVEIGDWDMDADAIVAVTHGLDFTKIRNVNVVIRDDTYGYLSAIGEGGSLYANATYIVLSRTAAGTFDNVNYDSTSYNRGWVTIQYVD